MVSYCVNPGCRAQFLYFRRGRLFAAPPDSAGRKIQCYWLCGDCVEHMDLAFEHDQRPVLVYRSNNPEQGPRPAAQKRRLTAWRAEIATDLMQ